MNSVTSAAPAASAHPCNCGCAKCKAECCELDCLVQPRFFCGQMLSDQDLTVLLDWVKGKAALTRYRHGWGIVCGLNVRCASTPGSGPTIGVSPGYAIDCCGNDIIICSDATLDLSACCVAPPSPCNGSTPAAPAPAPANNDYEYFGPFKLLKSEVQAVDIMIHYKESQSDPKTGLPLGGCSTGTNCEYTRTREEYDLYCKLVDDCDDPSCKRAEEWYQAYREGLRKLLAMLSRLEKANLDAAAKIARLLEWLRQNPPTAFCFLCDYLCDLQRQIPGNETWFRDVVFWIVQDWRMSYLRCLCEGCGPDIGVRLARVWLSRYRDTQGKQQCKVVYINAYPPFRSPVARDCWPAPSDSVSLAPFLWQTVDSSRGPLRQLGFSDVTFAPLEISSVEDLDARLSREKIVFPCSDEPRKLIGFFHEDHCKQRRIVYFGPEQDAVPRAGADSSKLPPDGPELDLQEVDGIGEGIAKRLQAAGIHNLVDLAAATPQAVQGALAGMPAIAQPDQARAAKFISDAQAALDQLKKGS